MPSSHHAVSHHAGQEGFNGSQHGNGQGIRHHLLNQAKCDMGHMEHRQAGGYGIQVPNGIHLQVQPLYQDSRHNDSHKGRRYLFDKSGPYDKDCQGQGTYEHCHGV